MSEQNEKPQPAPEPAAPVTDDNQASDLAHLEAMAEGDAPPGKAAQNEIQTAVIIAPIIDMLLGVFAPAWDVSQLGKQGLADAYAAVIDKYFPGGLAMGPEMSALIMTAAIIGPHLNQPRHPQPPAKKPDPDQHADQ